MAYKINWTQNGIYIKSYGFVQTKDVVEVIGKIVADPKFDSISYIIKDFTGVNQIKISDEDLIPLQ